MALHPERPCVAVFGMEGALIDRIEALQACGLRVARCTFAGPESDRGSLGRPLHRLVSVALAIAILARVRQQLAGVEVFWARSLDMAALALLARWIARSRAPLVYEVLEVPPVFLDRGLGSFVLRLVERIVLARSDLLVVGSPALMGHYFAPVQGYAAPWCLLGDGIHGAGGLAELCRRLLSRDGPTGTAGRKRVLARG